MEDVLLEDFQRHIDARIEILEARRVFAKEVASNWYADMHRKTLPEQREEKLAKYIESILNAQFSKRLNGILDESDKVPNNRNTWITRFCLKLRVYLGQYKIKREAKEFNYRNSIEGQDKALREWIKFIYNGAINRMENQEKLKQKNNVMGAAELDVSGLNAKEYLQNKYPQTEGTKWSDLHLSVDDWVAMIMEEYHESKAKRNQEKLKQTAIVMDSPKLIHLERLTRVEVIDDGRKYTRKDIGKVEISFQDDGRTLKVFIS